MTVALSAPPGRSRSRRPLDPVTQYATDVVRGKIVAGDLVRRASQRHLDDLIHGPDRGLRWDPAEAQRVIEFFPLLRHYKGEWGPSGDQPGRPIVLEAWQQFIVGSIFGWYRADGTRRFRRAYVEVAKKNGKTLMAAVIGVLLAFFDDEPGAEVYSAATKLDQAKLVWSDAVMMVMKNPDLRRRIRPLVKALVQQSTGSKFVPLGQDSDTDQGINAHGVIIDELHVHKDRTVVDNLTTATASRRQPLVLKITTAGVKREGIWADERADAAAILTGRVQDDSVFAVIYTLDEGDDPLDETVWPKANPNLGVSVKVDFLREMAALAARSPGAMGAFLRFHMDMPTAASLLGIDIDEWDACSGLEAGETYAEWVERVLHPLDEDGRRVVLGGYGGLDLASVKDLTAYVLLLRRPTGTYAVLCRFWCPADGVVERSQRDGVPYDQWVREGYLTATDGSVTDYAFVREEIMQLAEVHVIGDTGYDRWNATQLAVELQQDGAAMVAVAQTSAGLGPAWRELEKLMLDRLIEHGGHPILRWMAGNVEVETDAAGNQRPSKGKSAEKIDGMVALTIAEARWLAYGDEPGIWTAA